MSEARPGHVVGAAAFFAVAALSAAAVGFSARPVATVPSLPALAVVPEPAHVCHEETERVLAALEPRTTSWGNAFRHDVAEAVAEEAERAGFDPLLVLAVIDAESDFRIDTTSRAGARGIMQLRPDTLRAVAEREGLTLDDPALPATTTQVRLGTRYLRTLVGSFAGRMDLGLMAYNAGPNRLLAKIREGSTASLLPYVGEVRRSYLALRADVGEVGAWADAHAAVRSEVSRD